MAYEITFSQAGAVAINTDLLPSINAKKRQGFQLALTSLGTSGVVKVQGSNDETTWYDLPFKNTVTGIVATSTAVAGLFLGNVSTKFVRVRLTTAASAGTTAAVFRLVDDKATAETPTVAQTTPVSIAALPALAAGTATVGRVLKDVSATVANGPSLLVARLAAALASTNATVVKASAGRAIRVSCWNAAAAVRYLKLYNKATAPTVGTDVPVITIPLKPADVCKFELTDYGLQFSTGISYALTTGPTDADTGALTANDVTALSIVYI